MRRKRVPLVIPRVPNFISPPLPLFVYFLPACKYTFELSNFTVTTGSVLENSNNAVIITSDDLKW